MRQQSTSFESAPPVAHARTPEADVRRTVTGPGVAYPMALRLKSVELVEKGATLERVSRLLGLRHTRSRSGWSCTDREGADALTPRAKVLPKRAPSRARETVSRAGSRFS